MNDTSEVPKMLFSAQDGLALETLIDTIGDAVCVTDENMTFLAANRQYAAFYGMRAAHDLVGKNAFEVYPGFRSSVFFEACQQTIATGQTAFRVGFSANLNTWVVIRCYCVAPKRYAMVAYKLTDDVTKTGKMSDHDQLTSLSSRWKMDQDVATLLRHRQQAVLVLLDISHFSKINELKGFGAGDRCLMEVAARLRAHTHASDRVYRLGNDQFTVISTRAAMLQDPLPHVQQLLEHLGKPVALPLAPTASVADPQMLSLQFHAGISTLVLPNAPAKASVHPDSATEAAPLLNHAETALAMAKKRKASVLVYQNNMDVSAYNPQLHEELRHAIVADELEIHFQPQIDLIDMSTCGAEVLIRWKHPQKGLVSPFVFLPHAEESGLMKEIDNLVITKACQALAQLRQAHVFVPLSINLSAQSLCNQDVVAHITNQLALHNIPPTSLCVEITETSLVQDLATSQHIINALRDMGLKISIDDFGTGYSSMAYLLRYPTDYLKIDREFITPITTSEANKVIVRNIIGLAHGLGIGVVAEGVESQTEQDLLKSFGCDAVQGYLHSKPVDMGTFMTWLQTHPYAPFHSGLV